MKKLLLASAFVLATTTFARADDGEALTFGGQKMCSEITRVRDIESATMWGGWILGYWSGINAMQPDSKDGWVGESFVSTGQFGAPIVKMVLGECLKNPRQSLSQATVTIYVKLQNEQK